MKSPISDLLREQDLIFKELHRIHLLKPMKGILHKGQFEFITPELTPLEINLHFQLDEIKIKVDKVLNYGKETAYSERLQYRR